MTWPTAQNTTREKADLIRAAWRPGMGASALAVVLQTTRGSISGVYNRDKSLRTTHPLGGVAGRNNGLLATAYSRIRLNQNPRKPVETRQMREPHTAPMTLMDVCAGRCRWPVTETGPHLFCCQPCEGTYCEAHARMSVGEGTEQERSAHRVLRRAV